MPEHQAPNDKCVAQLVKAWRIVRTAIDPAEAVTQRIEYAVCLSVAERLPEPAATTTDEKRGLRCCWNVQRALPPVARLRIDLGRVYRQLAGLGELGFPYGQHPAFEIDISVVQMKGLGHPQSG